MVLVLWVLSPACHHLREGPTSMKWLGIYLLIGVIYVVLVFHSLNVLSLGFWLYVLLWLPLLVIHSVMSVIYTLIGVAIIAGILFLVMPEFRARVTSLVKREKSV
jgi:uncharacterized protein (DUF983 family)